MKRLLLHVAASTLLLALTIPTYAGDISTTVVPQPTPPSLVAGRQITTGITGQMDMPNVHGEISTATQASDSIIETVMSLVQSVLALF